MCSSTKGYEWFVTCVSIVTCFVLYVFALTSECFGYLYDMSLATLYLVTLPSLFACCFYGDLLFLK